MDTNGSSTLLFFDDWYLHRRENLVRHVGRPKLVTDGIFIDPHLDPSWGYPTVFVDSNTGRWRCLLTDPDGKPHPGYTFEDCIPFTGDALFWKPKWKNHPSVSEFMEKVVRLEVKLFNGRIYGIRGNFIPIRSGDYRQFKDQGIPPNPLYEQ